MATMTTGIILLSALLAAPGDPPSLDAVTPDPLPIGLTAEITGADFVVDQTTVTIASVPQNVVFTDAAKVVFLTSPATPLGPAELVVTTPYGQASTDVTVAPAPPKITSITPAPLVLGGLATLSGEHLEEVTLVAIDETACTVTAQTDAVIVFEVPFEGALLGDHMVRVEGESGYDLESVDIIAPAPVVDALAPNPVRIGDLVTAGGTIIPVPDGVSVTAGGEPSKLFEVADGSVTFMVPDSLSPGPADVVVTVAGSSSQPAGPLHVEAPDPTRPLVAEVYPSSASAGARVALVGEHLDAVEALLPDLNLTLGHQEPSLLVVDLGGLSAGLHELVVTGAAGASFFAVQVTDEALVQPQVDAVEPAPAFIGETLTVTGSGLFEVQSVLVGGVEQTVDFVDEGEVRVTLVPGTPLGAETLIAAGRSASNPVTVTILEPFAQPEPAPEAAPEVVEAPDAGPSAEPEPTPEAPSIPDTAGPDAGSPTSGAGDGGCQTGRAPGSLLWLALLLALWAPTRTRLKA